MSDLKFVSIVYRTLIGLFPLMFLFVTAHAESETKKDCTAKLKTKSARTSVANRGPSTSQRTSSIRMKINQLVDQLVMDLATKNTLSYKKLTTIRKKSVKQTLRTLLEWTFTEDLSNFDQEPLKRTQPDGSLSPFETTLQDMWPLFEYRVSKPTMLYTMNPETHLIPVLEVFKGLNSELQMRDLATFALKFPQEFRHKDLRNPIALEQSFREIQKFDSQYTISDYLKDVFRFPGAYLGIQPNEIENLFSCFKIWDEDLSRSDFIQLFRSHSPEYLRTLNRDHLNQLFEVIRSYSPSIDSKRYLNAVLDAPSAFENLKADTLSQTFSVLTVAYSKVDPGLIVEGILASPTAYTSNQETTWKKAFQYFLSRRSIEGPVQKENRQAKLLTDYFLDQISPNDKSFYQSLSEVKKRLILSTLHSVFYGAFFESNPQTKKLKTFDEIVQFLKNGRIKDPVRFELWQLFESRIKKPRPLFVLRDELHIQPLLKALKKLNRNFSKTDLMRIALQNPLSISSIKSDSLKSTFKKLKKFNSDYTSEQFTQDFLLNPKGLLDFDKKQFDSLYKLVLSLSPETSDLEYFELFRTKASDIVNLNVRSLNRLYIWLHQSNWRIDGHRFVDSVFRAPQVFARADVQNLKKTFEQLNNAFPANDLSSFSLAFLTNPTFYMNKNNIPTLSSVLSAFSTEFLTETSDERVLIFRTLLGVPSKAILLDPVRIPEIVNNFKLLWPNMGAPQRIALFLNEPEFWTRYDKDQLFELYQVLQKFSPDFDWNFLTSILKSKRTEMMILANQVHLEPTPLINLLSDLQELFPNLGQLDQFNLILSDPEAWLSYDRSQLALLYETLQEFNPKFDSFGFSKLILKCPKGILTLSSERVHEMFQIMTRTYEDLSQRTFLEKLLRNPRFFARCR